MQLELFARSGLKNTLKERVARHKYIRFTSNTFKTLTDYTTQFWNKYMAHGLKEYTVKFDQMCALRGWV